jgi:hypothetical protein
MFYFAGYILPKRFIKIKYKLSESMWKEKVVMDVAHK